MYQEVTFFSDEKLREKTSLIYDTFNQRIIEKWSSYQIKGVEDLHKMYKREVYVYANNHLYSKVYIDCEIDDCIFDNESISKKERIPMKSTIEWAGFGKIMGRKEIKYILTRSNFKSFCYKSLNIIVINDWPKKILKLESVIIGSPMWRGGSGQRLYKYIYSKVNPDELICVEKYEVLLNLTFINKFFTTEIFLGSSILRNIPKLFIKKKLSEKRNDLLNGLRKMTNPEMAYFDMDLSSESDVLIHNSLLDEDIFYKEKIKLLKTFFDIKKRRALSH